MAQNRLGFIGQLDSFRFFAVGLVIIWHWIPNSVVNRIPNGYLGVDFFFVLSGFLISANLLYAKKSIDDRKITNKKALLNFYARRFLRIFPLYYFTLFLVWLLNKNIYQGHVAWYLFYASNFLVFIKQAWQDSLSHFWSLAVEEQFYLIWPFLIFLVPLRLFKPFLFGTIILSMLYKVVASLLISNAFGDVLTIGAFDAFGFGALLAFKKVYGVDHWLLNTKNLKFTFPLLIMALLMYWYGFALPVTLVYPYFSILLIAKALAGYKGMAGQVLNNPVCRYFGKISYGIYVYHNFMPWLARCFMGVESKYPIRLKPVLKNWHPSMLLLLIFEFCLLVLIASSSWYCFERPLNSLKKFF